MPLIEFGTIKWKEEILPLRIETEILRCFLGNKEISLQDCQRIRKHIIPIDSNYETALDALLQYHLGEMTNNE